MSPESIPPRIALRKTLCLCFSFAVIRVGLPSTYSSSYPEKGDDVSVHVSYSLVPLEDFCRLVGVRGLSWSAFSYTWV